jgi:arylsulfatase A-like enzyme
MLSCAKGDTEPTAGDQLTLDTRRDCDTEYLRRATAFMRDAVQRDTPFFVYFNHSLMHMPIIPRAEFKGRTGNGDRADCLAQLDADFGTLLDLLTELGIAEDTLVVFAGDNGPEELQPWRGSPGYWEGSYFAGGEGNLRTPCIARWPGHIPAGRISNDIMHVTDWFATLLGATGIEVPADRVVDGIDQMSWLAVLSRRRIVMATSTGWVRGCMASNGKISNSFSSARSTPWTPPPSCRRRISST